MAFTDKNAEPYSGQDLVRYIDKVLQVRPPQSKVRNFSYQIIKRMFQPQILDIENIPGKPCLFVANHAMYAVDGPIIGLPMLAEHGRFIRALSDKFLWNPINESVLLNQGVVIGHPEVCSALMENGSDLIVFPGGAHEATKTADKKYQLLWKERYGFIKLAAKHGYTIVPTAIVGPEDFYDHLIEGEDLPNTIVGRALTKLGLINENTRSDLMGPIPLGLFRTLIPKPQKCYIQFGEPLDLSKYKGKRLAQKTMISLREEVAGEITTMIKSLLQRRDEEKQHFGRIRRLLTN
ncbi:lysophospholipid acyltransferase family protein [Zhongshania aquimaris]|uniref:Acyltransferase family protein n=1 Tax=Zhongshania aquimaris TaxID=2857107 RepID=A0ABS6VND9_9GAMM|nr:lysophospholipid acyltransferase family protein [Zhongshania aquimaris]MBW2939830.1 acyltransferase family protein [Zhongshania aquimaris]